jgi:hypothetical protein
VPLKIRILPNVGGERRRVDAAHKAIHVSGKIDFDRDPLRAQGRGVRDRSREGQGYDYLPPSPRPSRQISGHRRAPARDERAMSAVATDPI